MAINQKIRIRLKAFDSRILDDSARRIVNTAERNRCKCFRADPSPDGERDHYDLALTHVNKDSREQFEIRTHKRLIDILAPTSKTVESLMRLEMPAGVNIEIKL